MSRKQRKKTRRQKMEAIEQEKHSFRHNNRTARKEREYDGESREGKFVYKPDPILPKTEAQSYYLDALKDDNNVLTISYGSAGSGKTYLAAAIAIDGLLTGRFEKIVLTRPLTECSEDSKIGFLKGDLTDKILPYMLPVLEVFNQRIGAPKVKYLMEKGIIELAASELCRGRSFENTFLLVDEAQNLSIEQYFLMLSRIGEGTKVVVDGDIKQADIKNSGLADCINRMEDVEEVDVIEFLPEDCVRSGFCRTVIQKYNK